MNAAKVFVEWPLSSAETAERTGRSNSDYFTTTDAATRLMHQYATGWYILLGGTPPWSMDGCEKPQPTTTQATQSCKAMNLTDISLGQ